MAKRIDSSLVLPLVDIVRYGLIAIDVVRGRDVADLVRVLNVGFHEIRPVPAFDAVVVELLGGGDRGEEDEQSDGVLVVDLVEGVVVGSQRGEQERGHEGDDVENVDHDRRLTRWRRRLSTRVNDRFSI